MTVGQRLLLAVVSLFLAVKELFCMLFTFSISFFHIVPRASLEETAESLI